MTQISGCSRRPSVGEEIWGHDLPLNPALLRSGAGAGGRQSGNGAVSGTPVTGAERRAGNLAAPLRSHALRRTSSAARFWSSGVGASRRRLSCFCYQEYGHLNDIMIAS